MKKIKIIMHYPEEETMVNNYSKATNEMYLKAVLKLLNQSGLTVIEKKELLNHRIHQDSDQ